jgi:hypothetical protein
MSRVASFERRACVRQRSSSSPPPPPKQLAAWTISNPNLGAQTFCSRHHKAQEQRGLASARTDFLATIRQLAPVRSIFERPNDGARISMSILSYVTPTLFAALASRQNTAAARNSWLREQIGARHLRRHRAPPDRRLVLAPNLLTSRDQIVREPEFGFVSPLQVSIRAGGCWPGSDRRVLMVDRTNGVCRARDADVGSETMLGLPFIFVPADIRRVERSGWHCIDSARQ